MTNSLSDKSDTRGQIEKVRRTTPGESLPFFYLTSLRTVVPSRRSHVPLRKKNITCFIKFIKNMVFIVLLFLDLKFTSWSSLSILPL